MNILHATILDYLQGLEFPQSAGVIATAAHAEIREAQNALRALIADGKVQRHHSLDGVLHYSLAAGETTSGDTASASVDAQLALRALDTAHALASDALDAYVQSVVDPTIYKALSRTKSATAAAVEAFLSQHQESQP